MGLGQRRKTHPVHAAHAVPHVLHHQAVHLRRRPGRLSRPVGAGCRRSARLPLLEQPAPSALHLCHNQSGLRDYWAVAMLHGSPAEAPFGDAEAARVIAGTRTLQFAPGTRYSYVNQNFRILSDIVQHRTGRSFAELLRTRVFDRAGMATALLAADTRAMPDGTEGYEGTPAERVPRRGKPHPVDRRCRSWRQPRRHDRMGAPHRRDAR